MPPELSASTPRSTLDRPAPKIEGVRRIAVLRANGIGDFIFALPALAALRAAYPQARLTLLALPWHAEFLPGRAIVDCVEVIPFYRGVRDGPEDARETDAFFGRMRGEGFDLALQMHGGGANSNPFVLRLGAAVSAGLRAPEAPALDRWTPYVYFQPEVMRFLEVAALAGAPPVELEPRLLLLDTDLEEARKVLGDDDPERLIVLCPGAGDPRRRWPAADFARVADALAGDGYRIAVAGAAADRDLVGEVTAKMTAPALDLAGKLSLGGLAGLLSRARLVIGNDSGPLHLAAATGAATVGIYWCGNLINAGPFTRGQHRPLLAWSLACPVCHNDAMSGRCEHRASFVADVTVAEVLSAAGDLLGKAGREGYGTRTQSAAADSESPSAMP